MTTRLRADVLTADDASPDAKANAVKITSGVNAMIRAIEDHAADSGLNRGNAAECAMVAAVSIWRDMKAPKSKVQMVIQAILMDYNR